MRSGADLGFYNDGCPIHLKSAPEGWGLGLCPLCRKFWYFLYQTGEFLCVSGDINIDTVLFKKGTLIKRAGVRTPWTPPGFAPGVWTFVGNKEMNE